MISNFGGMSGYTVYKTNDSGIVSANPAEERVNPSSPLRQASGNAIRDTYESRPHPKNESNSNDIELKNIRRLLEEISSKLSYNPPPSRDSGMPAGETSKQVERKETTPSAVRPAWRNDIPLYNQMYGTSNPADMVGKEGPYNVLQACKNLHSWARTEYSQTEGFDTTYSPQELRDRISILSEIQNHINSSSGPAAPSSGKSAPITDRNIATYKAMKKDPDRITRRSYFEATV